MHLHNSGSVNIHANMRVSTFNVFLPDVPLLYIVRYLYLMGTMDRYRFLVSLRNSTHTLTHYTHDENLHGLPIPMHITKSGKRI
jgi:hypothetical protein